MISQYGGRLLNTEALSLASWGKIILLGVSVLVVGGILPPRASNGFVHNLMPASRPPYGGSETQASSSLASPSLPFRPLSHVWLSLLLSHPCLLSSLAFLAALAVRISCPFRLLPELSGQSPCARRRVSGRGGT